MFSLKWQKTKRRNTSRLLLVVFGFSVLCVAGFFNCPKDLTRNVSNHNQSLSDLPCHKNKAVTSADSSEIPGDTCNCSEDQLKPSFSFDLSLILQIKILLHLQVKLTDLASVSPFQIAGDLNHLSRSFSLSSPLKTLRIII